MSFVSNIVKRYIKKLIIHQANAYNHTTDELDMIVRIRDSDVVIITYSLRYRNVLNVLRDSEVEHILKS